MKTGKTGNSSWVQSRASFGFRFFQGKGGKSALSLVVGFFLGKRKALLSGFAWEMCSVEESRGGVGWR